MNEEAQSFPDGDPSLSYDSAKFELSVQLSSIDSLNQNLAVGISLSTAIVAILLAAFGIRFGQEDVVISRLAFGFLAAGGGFYLLSLGFLALAIQSRDFHIGLGAQDAWDVAAEYRDRKDVLYWWAAEASIKSLKLNQAKYAWKKLLANIGFSLLALELAIGATAIVLTIT